MRTWQRTALMMCLFGRLASAEDSATQAVAEAAAPSSSDIQSLLAQAMALQAESKWEDAIKVYEKIRQTEATNDAAMFGLGTCYSQTGRYLEGLALLEALLQKAPHHPAVLNNIAWICAKASDAEARNPDKALRYARRAVVTVPSDANMWNTLAEAYYAKGEYAKAYRAARQGMQLGRLASPETDLSASKELVERCRRAAGTDTGGEDKE
jgi:tetratricopeptide (TPR) repeat protein